jgi:hypothetical protein
MTLRMTLRLLPSPRRGTCRGAGCRDLNLGCTGEANGWIEGIHKLAKACKLKLRWYDVSDVSDVSDVAQSKRETGTRGACAQKRTRPGCTCSVGGCLGLSVCAGGWQQFTPT